MPHSVVGTALPEASRTSVRNRKVADFVKLAVLSVVEVHTLGPSGVTTGVRDAITPLLQEEVGCRPSKGRSTARLGSARTTVVGRTSSNAKWSLELKVQL